MTAAIVSFAFCTVVFCSSDLESILWNNV